jgi:serine/threonine protein phosphatase PrpC
MNAVATLAIRSASLTNPGKVRELNEDACLEHRLSEAGLWVVADGMGGHESGEVASAMIVSALKNVDEPSNLSEFIDAVEARLKKVHEELCNLAAAAAQPMTIGSTVAALLTFRNQAACLWAGDSRVYCYRRGELARLTRDHSEVEELVRQGLLRAQDAEAHPAANVLTSAVGAPDRLQVDVKFQALSAGDRYLVCSDGLYRELGEDEIANCLASGDVDDVCQTMVRLALDRGCHDNISVVVIEFVAGDATQAG